MKLGLAGEKEPYKVVISGSRDFTDYKSFCDKVHPIVKKLKKKRRVVIVQGGARGADALAHKYAWENGHQEVECPAHWTTQGKAAGPIRNERMARIATHCIAFVASSSIGTKDMINRAKKHNLNLTVFEIGLPSRSLF